MVAAIGLWLTGCATAPSAQEQAAFDYGPKPTKHEATIKAWFEVRLKDPFSAQYYFQEPVQSYLKEAPLMGGRLYVGWQVNMQVNAKNSFGGYTGRQAYAFFLKDEQIIYVVEPGAPVRPQN